MFNQDFELPTTYGESLVPVPCPAQTGEVESDLAYNRRTFKDKAASQIDILHSLATEPACDASTILKAELAIANIVAANALADQVFNSCLAWE